MLSPIGTTSVKKQCWINCHWIQLKVKATTSLDTENKALDIVLIDEGGKPSISCSGMKVFLEWNTLIMLTAVTFTDLEWLNYDILTDINSSV